MERRLSAILATDMVGYSRLMERNEEDVLARQKSHRKELIDPEIGRHRGRIAKTTGDGLLVEFASAQDAVRCAIDIQSSMTKREHEQEEDRRIRYRVGINLGDVVHDDGDIFGDGVNVAARLESLAEPGGVCISDIVYQTVLDRIGEPFRDMGSQRVKNISRPIRVWQWTPNAAKQKQRVSELASKQRVRFCTSADGTQIAYATVGVGPPIFKAPNFLNHIEYEWGNPYWKDILTEFARQNTLVRFDQRGNGLSDWEVKHISIESMIEDMEAVVEAAGLNKFALFGISQGAGFSLRYAAKHPEQVSCIILFGGFARGRLVRNDPEQRKRYEIVRIMIREGWGSPNPIYRNFFTTSFLPDASLDVQNSFDELQRISCSPENALRIAEMNNVINVVETAKSIQVPTLVLHNRGDRMVSLAEGQELARLIPGAIFVEQPGNNHIALEGDPSFDQFFDEVRAFLAEHASVCK
jgi:class 3 adenylate cyclase/pimeloyl-ACP methyl ester carboxylesterase